MRATKRLTLSAMAVALGAVLLAAGAVWEVVDLTAAAVASLIMAFVYIELGSPYTYFVWLGTSLASFIIFPSSIVWAEYLAVFGIYPLLKALIERAPRILWWVCKLVYINAVIAALMLLVEQLFGVPFFDGGSLLVNAALWVLIVVAFVAYDMFLTVMVRLYMAKYRKRIRKYLK